MNNKIKGIIWGCVIIGIGLIWGLKEAGVISNVVLFDGWWTLFIIVPCFIGLITDKNKIGSIIGLAIGGSLLANYYMDFDSLKGYVFPLVFIVLGVGIVLNNVFSKKNTAVFEGSPEPIDVRNAQEYYATFSGQNLTCNEQYSGGKYVATFGGVKLDLRNADIQNGAVINCSATFGGVDILVPQNIRVQVKSNSIFGGVEDKSNKNLPIDAKVLYVNSSNVFGGTEIK